MNKPDLKRRWCDSLMAALDSRLLSSNSGPLFMCGRCPAFNHFNELNISNDGGNVETAPSDIYWLIFMLWLISSVQNRSNVTFIYACECKFICSVLFSGFWVGTGVFLLSQCNDSFPVFLCKNSHQHFEQTRSADLKLPQRGRLISNPEFFFRK